MATASRRRTAASTPQCEGLARRFRAGVVESMRGFFADHGFLEVDTPLLVPAPGSEAMLDPVVAFNGNDRLGWLITSPEHHMKRLLSDGEQRIFQLCRCFRGGERTPHHRVEFTMAEWYRRGADYLQIATDVEELVGRVAADCTGDTVIPDGLGGTLDLSPPWTRWTVHDALVHFAGVELTSPEEGARFAQGARDAGIASVEPGDDWETTFYKILIERVEPALAREGKGVHLLDWPAPMAALARLKSTDPSVAERVESYAGGLELSNGFSELTDPRQQRRRFREERCRRRARQQSDLPIDEQFLQGLATGMPDAAGVALGLDRLLLLLSPDHDLRHVAPHFMEHRERE
ncbi:MAG: EF-P lysine aminoacylase GenX [Gemmatimonadetes bacterium]|nr:EF-P lysine aminoacylase GenX [Gemmatimonadota bacterium]MBT6148261.1 EF-P lysine aminoacylase GenX [Gemmatimonadota bacterium]MBT7863403.1 EF-P lysine aminoacylase GenX [Gemmatimonadota bacterium]